MSFFVLKKEYRYVRKYKYRFVCVFIIKESLHSRTVRSGTYDMYVRTGVRSTSVLVIAAQYVPGI